MSQQTLETIDEILAGWKVDSEIDQFNLGKESIRFPKLHSKYLDIMVKHDLRVRATQKKYDVMYRDKYAYYTGKMSVDRLKELGWEPFDYKMGNKIEAGVYMNADKELQALVDIRVYHEKAVEACDKIIKAIMGISYHITNAINVEKMRNGG